MLLDCTSWYYYLHPYLGCTCGVLTPESLLWGPYLLCASSCSWFSFPCLGKGLCSLCPSSDPGCAAEPASRLPAARALTHPAVLPAPGSCAGWGSCPELLQQGRGHLQAEGWGAGLCPGEEALCFIGILSLEGLWGHMGPFLFFSIPCISFLFLNIPKCGRLCRGIRKMSVLFEFFRINLANFDTWSVVGTRMS